MSKIIKLRKGLDINLQGKAAESLVEVPMAGEYAVSPLDFEGVIPKLLVKAGDKVKAGTPLFFDKKDSRVLFTSPVSGTVSAVNRGEKRKVLNVTVAADATQEYETFPTLDLRKANRSEVIEVLLKSGLWTMIRQRPYGIIANPDDAPKSIFVSAFDSAPLAPDMNFVLRGEKDAVQKGLEVLGKLTDGKVHLSMRAKAEGDMASMKGVELHSFEGKHPVGNVGVQIHHIDPIAKGDIVWTAGIQDVAAIGRLFLGGKVDLHKTVALTGSEAVEPKYYRIVSGAPVASVVGGNIKPQAEGDKVRIISGNVLTGKKVGESDFITADANQITLIPEGDTSCWAGPRPVSASSRCRARISRGSARARSTVWIPISTAVCVLSWLRVFSRNICLWISIPCISSRPSWRTTSTRWRIWAFTRSWRKMWLCASSSIPRRPSCSSSFATVLT